MKLLRHDLHTLTGAYALDAIDGAERERFEHHLDRCQSCDHEVRGLQETATRLALAVAARAAAGLKAAVLAGGGADPAAPAGGRHQARGRAPRRGPAAPAGDGVRRRWPSVLVVVLAVALVLQRRQLDTARAQQHQVAAVLAAPDARIVAGRTSVGGTATVVASRRLHELVFTSAGLPVLASSKVYQLWLIGPSGARPRPGCCPAPAGPTAPVLAAGLVPGDWWASRSSQPAAPGSRPPSPSCLITVSILTMELSRVRLGDAHLDVVVRQLGPVADDTDTPARTLVGPGGQAANVAAWVAALGGRSRLLYARGSDLAAGLVAADLTGRGVELAGPVMDGRTGVVVSLSDGGTRRSMITDRGVGPRLRRRTRWRSPGWTAAPGCTCPPTAWSRTRSAAPRGPRWRPPPRRSARLSVDLSSTAALSEFGAGPVHRPAGRAASRCGIRHRGRDRPDRRAGRPGDRG